LKKRIKRSELPVPEKKFRLITKKNIILFVAAILVSTVLVFGASRIIQNIQNNQAMTDFNQIVHDNMDDPRTGVAGYFNDASRMLNGEVRNGTSAKTCSCTLRSLHRSMRQVVLSSLSVSHWSASTRAYQSCTQR